MSQKSNAFLKKTYCLHSFCITAAETEAVMRRKCRGSYRKMRCRNAMDIFSLFSEKNPVDKTGKACYYEKNFSFD